MKRPRPDNPERGFFLPNDPQNNHPPQKKVFNRVVFNALCQRFVAPSGIEPLSEVPETSILSVELWSQAGAKVVDHSSKATPKTTPMAIRLNLKRTTGKTTTVRAIVRIDGKKSTVSTGVKIQVRDWDRKRERCRTDDDANARLRKAVEEIQEYVNRFGRAPEAVGQAKNKQDVLQVIDEYRKRKVQESTSPHTWRAYSTLSANIWAFTSDTKTPIPRASNVTAAYIENLIAWMKGKNYSTSHTNKMIRTLRSVLKPIVPNEMRFIRPPTAHPRDAVYLNTDEIRLIETVELEPTLARARDLFLIGLYSGQRFSDWYKIVPSRTQNSSGIRIISLSQQKTKSQAVLLVTDKLQAVWDRYPNGLPALSNQKFNQYVKEVAKIAGITEPVQVTDYRMQGDTVGTFEKWQLISSHTARRSFATNAAIAGIPLQEIMRFTGHKTVATLLIYLRNTGIETAVNYAGHPFFQ